MELPPTRTGSHGSHAADGGAGARGGAGAGGVPGRAETREQHAAHTIAIRVLLDIILTTQAAVLEGTLGGTVS